MIKKLILSIALCYSIAGFTQKMVSKKIEELHKAGVTFKHYDVLTKAGKPDAKIEKEVKDATLASINMQVVNDVVANKDEYIEVTIPYKGNVITIELYKAYLFNLKN